jgi:ribose 5-phosphate isomerase B
VKVAFGADETTDLTELLVRLLGDAGHDVVLASVDQPWPEVGRTVGEAVASGVADRGVVCCWTGTGVSIAAAGARRWNDANVLAIGLRLTSPAVAREMVDAFFSTEPDPSEAANIARLP